MIQTRRRISHFKGVGRCAAASLLALAPALVEVQPGYAAQAYGAGSTYPGSSLRASPYDPSPGHAAGAALDQAGGAPGYAPAYPPQGERVRVGLGGGQGRVRTLSLPRGKSAVIELPVDAKDVLVSDPKVADVVLSTPRRIYVMGMGSGQTDAAFFDAAGRELLRLDVRVDQDVSAVGQTLARVLPGSGVRVDAVNQNIILSGDVANAAEADKAMRIAASFVARPEQVLNMMSIRGGEQVMLKVKVVEMNRTVIKQLGFDLSSVIGQIGGPQYLFSKAITFGVNGALLGGVNGGYNYDSTSVPTQIVPCAAGLSGTCQQVVRNGSTVIGTAANGMPITSGNYNTATPTTVAGKQGINKLGSTIQAFERVGMIRTLAEPNLTAVSGESAKFLAGGEFPVPVGQDNNGRVTIEFKPYGVGLGFTPVVLSNGLISLKLSTEVSEITNIGGVTLSTTAAAGSTGATVVVPGLTVRRAETTVELPSGGAMMIAGLMQSQTKQTLDSLPGLMQLPVLGSLFRSRDFLNNETELVVVVTPYIVHPVRPDQLQTPVDGLEIADDLSTDLLGRLNKGFAKPGQGAQPLPAGRTYAGPYGYVVE